MNQEIIDDIRTQINWPVVLNLGNGLADCNDKQWRFIKGLIIELAVDKHSNGQLKYVGEDHKDFDWNNRNLTVELKSQMSADMYGRKNKLKSKFKFRLNNSNGTNKSTVLDPDIVADIILVPMSDGVYAVDKSTVLQYYKHSGDGFDVVLPKKVITEITGPMPVIKSNLGLKQIILNAIHQAIP